MADINKRLAKLEHYVENMGKSDVEVLFKDGSSKRLPASDVIPLLLTGEVVEIEGEDGNGSGKLLSLMRGLID